MPTGLGMVCGDEWEASPNTVRIAMSLNPVVAGWQPDRAVLKIAATLTPEKGSPTFKILNVGLRIL